MGLSTKIVDSVLGHLFERFNSNQFHLAVDHPQLIYPILLNLVRYDLLAMNGKLSKNALFNQLQYFSVAK